MNESGIIGIVTRLGLASFFLEIITARIIVLCSAKKRKFYPIRFVFCFLLCIAFYFMPSVKIGSFSYSYVICVVGSFLCGLFLYDEKIPLICYSSIAAWGIQHRAWNLLGILFDLIPNIRFYPSFEIEAIYYCGFLFIYGIFFLFFYLFHIEFRYSKKHFVSFIFASVRIVATRFLSQSIKNWNITIRIYTFLTAFLSLVIRIAYPYLSVLAEKEKNLVNEKKNLESRISLQAKQQELSKETIDVINRKFHDRKNQILSLEKRPQSQSKVFAKELGENIDIYKDIARTGNEAVDIIITQKSLLCTSKNIRFTYILDGKALDFRSRSDITSLYGNIIDNAIEATNFEEGEFRLIKLKTYQQNGFAIISEENYCHKNIQFGNSGLPISSKKDSINHGYGTKSIQYIVHNYHGQLSRKQEDGIFYLSILLPLPTKKDA